MKSLFLCIPFLWIVSMLNAQTINQPGEVRSISYQLGVKGAPIADVRIKSLVEVRSEKDGKFLVPVSADGKDYFTFTDIFKPGYELVIPSMDEFGTRRFAINPGVRHTIVMVNRNERNAESNRIAEQLRRKNEEEIEQRENQIAMLNSELQVLREQNRDANDLERQVESLQSELQKFRQTYYASDELIRKEAERLSKIDYYELDSIQAVIYNLLKEGRGEEVVQTARSQISDELWAKIMADPGSIKQELVQKTQLVEQLTHELQQDSLLLEQLAQQLKNMADGFAAKYQNDSAAFYLKKRIELDTTNIDNIGEYAQFISDYFADYKEAIHHYNRCISLTQMQKNKDFTKIDIYNNNIGVCYSYMDEYDKALEYHFKALNIKKTLYGADDLKLAANYGNIGAVYQNIGDYKKGLKFYMMDKELQEKSNISDSTEYAHSLNNIGSLYAEIENYSEALENYEKARIIWENTDSLNPDVAISYINIGYIYDMMQDFQTGLKYHSKALAKWEKIYGHNHPNVASVLNNIGYVYRELGYSQKALEYYTEALKIRKNVLGENSLDVAVSYNNIAFIFDEEGEFEKALKYYNKSLSIKRELLGNDHPSVATSLNNIAYVLNMEGKSDSALILYQRSLKIRETVYGNQNPVVADSYCNIGKVYKSMNNFKAALENNNLALSIFEKSLGKKHVKTIKTAELSNKLEILISPHAFLIEPNNNGLNNENIISGKHIVLRCNNWEFGDQKELKKEDFSYKDHPFRIVLLKDDLIMESLIKEGETEIQLDIKVITRKEEARILQKYLEWKTSQTNK